MRARTSPPSLNPRNRGGPPPREHWNPDILARAGSGKIPAGPDDRSAFRAELPKVALSRIARLREVAEGSNTLSRDLMDRRTEVQQQKQQAEAPMRQLIAGRTVGRDHPSVTAALADAAAAAQAYEDLSERYSRYAPQSASARLVLQ